MRQNQPHTQVFLLQIQQYFAVSLSLLIDLESEAFDMHLYKGFHRFVSHVRLYWLFLHVVIDDP